MITQWSAKWQMPISIKKCSVMLYGNRRISMPSYQLCDCVISSVDVMKDLGVMMDSTLKFNAHIDHIVAKARRRAYLIRKCFVSRDPDLLIRAFNVYVRPLLEYASPVWSPQYRYQIDKVESVQRRFTKSLRGYSHLDYPSRLKALALQSLEKRRLIFDLVFTYKIIFGLIDVPSSVFYKLRCSNNVTTRGNPYKIQVSNCRVNARLHYFSERVALVWNSLPPSIIDFGCLSSFKKTLFNVNLNLFTTY